MHHRVLGRTGRPVSVVGLGSWQLGAEWGDVSEQDAVAAVHAALDAGMTFIDTADVYGDGRSEKLIGRALGERPSQDVFVATKMGRRMAQEPQNYSLSNFRAWIDRSRKNLQCDCIDLVQLHCPPTEVIASDGVHDALGKLVEDGVIAAYGVSVETCDQALLAIDRPGVASVQIILNILRRKPLDVVLPAAERAGVGIIARVPLASGLLANRYTQSTAFAADDHRAFNRNGEAFDVGETFSGVDFATGIAAARAFAELLEAHSVKATPAQAALAWIIQQRGVTTVIPGARNQAQARDNAAAADLPSFGPELLTALEDLYDRHFRAAVHHRW